MDNAFTEKLVHLQIEIEESEKVGTQIPVAARIRAIKTRYDVIAKKGQTQYLKLIYGTGGEFGTHYVDFTW